jgi:hypothetical protein
MSVILGVDENIILRKIKIEFTEALAYIVEQNLDLLAYEEGVDK